MSEEERPVEEEAPTPRAPNLEEERARFFRNFNEFIEQQMGRHSVATVPGPVAVPVAIPGLAETYEDLDEKTKKAIDEFIEEIKPDVEKKAAELLLSEIREKVARTGDINKIIKARKKGKKATLKQKKGCIFIQLGTGDPGDEIEEVLVATT